MSSTKSAVVLLPSQPPPPQHERQTHAVLGKLIAELLGAQFSGDYSASNSPSSSSPPSSSPPNKSHSNNKGVVTTNTYFIPTDTLTGDTPASLNIRDETDLFGGVVADSFMATKAITHPLFSPDAAAPKSWSTNFTLTACDATLTGFTVFSIADAERAGRHLLKTSGPLRIKPVRGKAGRGQVVVRDEAALQQALAQIDDSELATWGLTLEEQLEQVVTYSVGQAIVAGIRISYYGTQQLTRDNDGESVYGGSDLVVVRGGYESLVELALPNKVRVAVGQARIYDAAARSSYPSLIASRLNYDIAQGINTRGEFRSGVLEQSWRIGGASGAEVLALQAFSRDSSIQRVRACTIEIYGESEDAIHNDATVLFHGDDAAVGRITKIARVLHSEGPLHEDSLRRNTKNQ